MAERRTSRRAYAPRPLHRGFFGSVPYLASATL
jgi:hypothetical protein